MILLHSVQAAPDEGLHQDVHCVAAGTKEELTECYRGNSKKIACKAERSEGKTD